MTPLFDVALKVTLILAATLAVAATLRRQSASLRHWVLSVGIVCAAATPLMIPIAPSWRTPRLFTPVPSPQPLASAAVPAHEYESPTAVDSSAPVTAPAPSGSWRFSPIQWAMAIWIVGAIAGALFLIAGLLRLSWIRSRARRMPDGRWTAAAQQVANDFGIRRSITLLYSDHPSLLFTWGHFRPVVILPRDAGGWSSARAHIVLCHELAHIRRGDWLTLIAAECLRAVYWFNPLAWIVGKRLRDESERACDDEVIGQGIEGADYATELLALARILNAQRPGWVAASAMARPSSLERRVTAMVNNEVNRQPVEGAPRVMVLALMLAMAVAIGGYTLAAQTFASYAGSVLDQTGNVVTGVSLSMTNKQTGQKYQVKSNDTGAFEFVGLVPGEYDLETFSPGFRTKIGAVAITKNLRSDVRLEVGSLEETITVVDRGEPRVEGTGPVVRNEPRVPEKPACVTKPTGGYIVQPTKIADKRPVYPRSGGVPKAGNVVVLDARIGTDGTVVEARGVDPTIDQDLVSAAIEAVKLWRYTPTLLNCVPIEVQMKVTVNFRTE
jgi:beta-lactamase regulating signal transducer with metallopeptidase domain